jgi:outer membrane autotransporter protein
MRASRDFVTAQGLVFVPQLRAGWLHEFLETDTLVTNRFGSVAGSSFAAQGLDLGRDWALLGGGMGWRVTERITLTGDYDAQINERQVFHIGSANVQYVW